jgi:hypothetical protein
VRRIGDLATAAGKSTSYEQNVTPGADKNYCAGDLVIRGGARSGKDLVINVGIVFGGQFDRNGVGDVDAKVRPSDDTMVHKFAVTR